MKGNQWGRVLWSALTLVATLALAACGSSSSSSTASTSTTTKSTKSAASAPGATATVKAAGSGPGVGKPPVTIGDKNFTEEFILGSLYQEALAAKGYKVTLKGNIGSSEITYRALTGGQIDMFPEYTGTLLSAIAGDTKPPQSAAQAYSLSKAFVERHGLTLLAQTPYFNSDALAATKAFATKHHLRTISDLKPLGKSVKLGGAPEFATRFAGLAGLKQVYGVSPTFVPLAIGITYKAIDSGQVGVFDAFTTDPQLLSGKYVLLSDPKRVFGFQNVAPMVKKSVLAAEGPAFAQTIDKVSALLTLPAIQKMNAAVGLDQQSPANVARQFLKANGLA
ncbi:MAG: glycine betaine ABC transporter substrate-binding protein [Solirubrobacteraceae bacterium]